MKATRIARPHNSAVRMSLRVLTTAPDRGGVRSSIAATRVRSTLVRRLVPLFVAVGLLGVACGGSDGEEAATPGMDAPTDTDGATTWPHDFVAATVDGGMIDAGEYAGQDLVLWFWAPW